LSFNPKVVPLLPLSGSFAAVRCLKVLSLIAFACSIIIQTASSQIHITTNETWQADTVRVEQNIIIDEGASLTINPGTVVYFLDQNFIDVYGELNIHGAEGDSVVMTAIDSTWIPYSSSRLYYGWAGIFAYNNGSVSASYTVFEKLGNSHHSKDGSTMFGVLHNESSMAMAFDHCRFALKRDAQQTSEGCTLEASKAAIIITSSVFRNNTGNGSMISVSKKGSFLISNTTFRNNDIRGFLIAAMDAFFTIEGCRFENNKARALFYGLTREGPSSIEQNTFLNNQGAISIEGIYADIYFRNNIYKNNGGQVYFWLGQNVITGNVFQDNYYADPYDFFLNDYSGIVRTENTVPIILNNSFIDNRATALSLSSTPGFNIGNNLFYNNYPSDTFLPFDPESLNTEGRRFQYNLLKDLFSGPGNRIGNPRLAGEEEFQLAANSPAIDNGSDTFTNYLLPTDLLGNPRIVRQIDIGAVEFPDTYVSLTDIHISDTVVPRVPVGEVAFSLSTESGFEPGVIAYTLVDVNGVNNDYFSFQGNHLVLEKELTTETLLRIKVRATHPSGAWMEKYFDLTNDPVVTGVEHPSTTSGKVYPIPTDKFLYVDESVPRTTYSIFSVSGVKVQSGLAQEAIDVSNLADGVYILQLMAGNKVERIKIHKYSR
jgi:hypothetical protein